MQVNQLCVKNMSLIGRRLLKGCEDGTEIAIKISIRPLEIRINFEGGNEKWFKTADSAGDGTYGHCLRVHRIHTAGILGQRAAAGIFPEHHCNCNGDHKYCGILPDTERGRSAEIQQR